MSKSLAPGFLEAILENPDDDAPRLIYADWLEDTGEAARAEFIRVQCERARLPEWDARWLLLGWRERELLDRYDAAWRSELPRIGGVEWGDFRRGFLATLTVDTVNTLAASAEALFDAAPVDQVTLREELTRANMRRVPLLPRLRGLTAPHVDDLAAFAAWPVLSTLKTLSLPHSPLNGAALCDLAESVHLNLLTTLQLELQHAEPRDIEVFAERAGWHGLTRLALRGTRQGRYAEGPPIDSGGAAALARAKVLSNLKSLDLSGNEIGGHGIRAILDSPHLTALEQLNLSYQDGLEGEWAEAAGEARSAMGLKWLNLRGNLIGDRGLAAIVSSPLSHSLASLDLETCEIGPEGMRCLSRGTLPESLNALNLTNNGLGTEGIRTLRESNREWSKLHTLVLASNDLDAGAGVLLGESEGLNNLLSLDLTGNNLATSGVRALVASPHLGQLRELRLGDNKIGAAAVEALAERPFEELRHLVLNDNRFGDDGMAALARAVGLRKLGKLDLRGIKAGDHGLAAFATGHWPNLGHLDLTGNRVGVEGVHALLAAEFVRNLRRLLLNGNPVRSEGARAIAASEAVAGLWHLGLNGCGIDPEGLEALARSPHLDNLRSVALGGNIWRRDTWDLLRNRFGEHIW